MWTTHFFLLLVQAAARIQFPIPTFLLSRDNLVLLHDFDDCHCEAHQQESGGYQSQVCLLKDLDYISKNVIIEYELESVGNLV